MAAGGNWAKLPDRVLECLFADLNIDDLRNCSLVCKNWYKYLNGENNDVWRMHCVRKLAEEALQSDMLINAPTYKAKLRAFFHSWNPNDCSRNICIKSDGFTIHRNPVAQSTDGARGKIGFRSGRHCWEIWWQGPLGTVAVIGLATPSAPLQNSGYVPLLGSNDQSWGWNLVENHLLHNGDSQGNYPQLNAAPKYQVYGDFCIRLKRMFRCVCLPLTVAASILTLNIISSKTMSHGHFYFLLVISICCAACFRLESGYELF